MLKCAGVHRHENADVKTNTNAETLRNWIHSDVKAHRHGKSRCGNMQTMGNT